jgi:uncharacterized glyoxalase superfamily protein PhnB
LPTSKNRWLSIEMGLVSQPKESLVANSSMALLLSSICPARLKLAIWAQDDIVHDTGLPKQPVSPTAFTIGHNVADRGEVDENIESARRAGAEVVKDPQPTFYGGYAGYFRDPDGHLWEIVWNPELLPSGDR